MKTILFIEDEVTLQKTLQDTLSQEGYKIISAFDGEIGLSLAKTKNPDLILLDLILPKIHGFQVLKKLKESLKTKDIPVIVLTNLESVEDIEKAVELGITTYLVKTNFTPKEVFKKIKMVIGV